MKKIGFLFLLVFFAAAARCDVPGTECPSGYTPVSQPEIILASSCTTNYTNCGNASSCAIQSPDAVCFMFAPTDTVFTDTSGQYEYTEICMLDESI